MFIYKKKCTVLDTIYKFFAMDKLEGSQIECLDVNHKLCYAKLAADGDI